MGNCDLTFNRIVIQNQKSDSDHADNDWLHVAWVVGGPDNPQTIEQTLPLLNAQGSPILHGGDVIPEFTVSCNANDAEVVMAVYTRLPIWAAAIGASRPIRRRRSPPKSRRPRQTPISKWSSRSLKPWRAT